MKQIDNRSSPCRGLERERSEQEYAELEEKIAEFKEILANPKKLLGVIKEEITVIRDKYGDDRRTAIGFADDMDYLVDIVKCL